MSGALVALRFARPSWKGPHPNEWWLPRAQLERRIRALSNSSMVRALRVGPVDADHNPPALIAALEAELGRRLTAGEWIPNLTAEEMARWRSAASVAAS